MNLNSRSGSWCSCFDFHRAKGNSVERRTLPGPDYFDPAIFELDREQIFFRSWVMVGLSEQAEKPGQWFRVDVVGESILIMRGQDMKLRGFYNVCRHRGSRLREEESGTENGALACPYHDWCYSFEGALVATPRVEKDEINRDAHGLRPVHLDEWQGCVFVNLDRETPVSLREWIGNVNPDMLTYERYDMGSLRMTSKSEFVVEANWKIVIENYCECLHCPSVHPELVELIPAYKTGWVFDPARDDGGVNSTSRNYGPATAANIALMPTVSEDDANSVYGGTIFPNCFIDIAATGVVISQVMPVSATSTRISSMYMFHPNSIAAPDFDASTLIAFSDMVTNQDNSVCERAQRGVTSRSFADGGVYPEKDEYVWQFNQQYLQSRDAR